VTNAAAAQAALIHASWSDAPAGAEAGRPVECLSPEAIFHALELAAAGWGTVSFTANAHAAAALGLSGPATR